MILSDTNYEFNSKRPIHQTEYDCHIPRMAMGLGQLCSRGVKTLSQELETVFQHWYLDLQMEEQPQVT